MAKSNGNPAKADPERVRFDVKEPGVGTGHGSGQTGPKRTKDQRKLNQLEMIALISRGWTKAAVARKFGLHHTMITVDWKVMVKELRECRADELDDYVAIKLEEYGEIKREAWEAWERSKLDAMRKSVETNSEERTCTVCEGSGVHGGRGGNKASGSKPCFYCGGKGKRPPLSRTTETVTGSVGDARYLSVICNAIAAERVLLALDPARKVELSGSATVDWSVLAGHIPAEGPVPDRVEEEIARAAFGAKPAPPKGANADEGKGRSASKAAASKADPD